MQLTAFRIFRYRNIEDSGLVALDNRLTCIVGKNQSGKTNLLKALQKLNPRQPTVRYDARSDWPRGRRRGRDNNQLVCEAHFTLGAAEQGELAGLAGLDSPPTKVVVTKNYAGEYGVTFPDDPELFAAHLNQGDTSLERKALAIIVKQLPTFIYMDEHRTFEGLGASNARADPLLSSGRWCNRRNPKTPYPRDW